MDNGLFISRLVFFAALSAMLACAVARAGEEVVFSFQPPEGGITLLHTSTKTKTESRTFEGATQTRVSVSTQKMRIAIAQSEEGYTWTQTLVSHTETVSKKPQALSPLEKAMLNAPITIELDKTGQLIVVRGVDDIIARARAKMDAKALAAFDRETSPAKVVASLRESWEEMAGAFHQQRIPVGGTLTTQVDQPLFSSMPLTVTTTVTLERQAVTAGRPCAVFKETWSPDLAKVADDLSIRSGEMGVFPLGAGPTFTVFYFTSVAYRHVDLALAITLKSSVTRSFKFKVAAEGKSMIVTGKTETGTSVEVLP